MLTAIFTFELSYFNCDMQIAMRDEGAGRNIDNEPPLHSVTQAVNSSLQAYKSFSRTQKRKVVRLEF